MSLINEYLHNAGLATKVSMEEFEENIEEVIEDAGAPADPVAEEVASVEDESEELDNLADDIDETADVAESLEALVVTVESALADGGLTAREAAFADAAMQQACRRLRVAAPVLPSLESFGGTSERAAATRISLEGFKDTLVKMWEAIKRAVRGMMAKLKDFWASITSSANKLRKRATSLTQSISDGDFSGTPKDLKLSAGLAKYLTRGGSVIKATNASDSVKAIGTDVLGGYTESVIKALKGSGDVTLPSHFNTALGRLPGAPKVESEQQQGITVYKFSNDFGEVKETKASAESQADLSKICKDIQEFAVQLEAFEKKGYARLNQAVEAKISEMDKAVRAASDEVSAEEKEKIQKTRVAANTAGTFPRAVSAYGVGVAGGLLAYVAFQLAAYSKAKKD